MSARLAVLVPSRGRPGNIVRLHNAIQATADRPVDIHVRVDLDDPAGYDYRALTAAHVSAYPSVTVHTGDRTRLARSWNELAEALHTQYDHFALWGDDVIPRTAGWDRLLTDPLMDRPGWSYGLDGVWDHTFDRKIPGHLVLPTATVMSTDVYRAVGYVAPPGFRHLCVDLVWRDLGLATDRLNFRRDVTISHMHPCRNLAATDAVYEEANSATTKRIDNNAFREWRETDRFATDVAKIRKALG